MEAVLAYVEMGGYGAYVWPAYGLTALILGGMLLLTLRGLRTRQRELKAFEGADGGRRRRRREPPETTTTDDVTTDGGTP